MPPVEEKAVAEGFKAAGERMSDIEGDLKVIKGHLQTITQSLKSYGQALITGTLDGKDYPGFWPNENMAKDFGAIVMKALGKVVSKDFATLDNTAGGNLVPESLANWIIQKLGIYGKFRKNAVKVRMASGTQYVPKILTDMTIYAPGEGGIIEKSDVRYGLVNMTAKKFACLAVLSRELEEDALIGVGEIIGISITRSMAKKEDLIGFLGDGTSEYFGMTGICGAMLKIAEDMTEIPGLVTVEEAETLEDFRRLVGLLPEDADENAKWLMSKKYYFNTVYPLAEKAGNAGIFEILSSRKDRFLLGYPVEFVGCMPAVPTPGKISAILGDLELGAYLGERREMEIARSDEVLFGNDLIAIRGTERVDISAYGVGDKDEPGAIVALATAAGE